MRKFLSLFAAVLFAGSMMAGEVTLTMSDFQATSFEAEGISVSTAKNAGSNEPVYNATGKDLRIYAKGSITISADQNITGISFVISNQGKKRLAPLTANVGSVAVAGDPDFTAEWTGSASSVTITVGDKADYGTDGNSKAGQLDFTAIVVTLGEADPKGYYVVGNFTEWQIETDYKMWENPDAPGEYMMEMFLMPEVQFKVVYSEDGENIKTWFPDGTGNAYGEHGEIEEAGGYIIYFNPAGGVDGWFEGYLSLALQPDGGEVEVMIHDYEYDEEYVYGTSEDGVYAVQLIFAEGLAAGSYTENDLTIQDDDYVYCYIEYGEGEDDFTAVATANINVTALDEGFNIDATLVGENGVTYFVHFLGGGEYVGGDEEILTCADAAAAALTVADDGKEEYNDGQVYTIDGYVTGIKTAWSSQYKNISFWMADEKDGGEVIQAFRAVCESEADAPQEGDKVRISGKLINYHGTPEFAAGCTYEILIHQGIEETVAEGKAVKVLHEGTLLIMKGNHSYTSMGQIVK